MAALSSNGELPAVSWISCRHSGLTDSACPERFVDLANKQLRHSSGLCLATPSARVGVQGAHVYVLPCTTPATREQQWVYYPQASDLSSAREATLTNSFGVRLWQNATKGEGKKHYSEDYSEGQLVNGARLCLATYGIRAAKAPILLQK